MEVKILGTDNKEAGKRTLPAQFSEAIRPDLIKRAVQVIQNNKRQKYGSDPRAGKKTSADLSRRRRTYRGSYGKGISRVPRKIVVRRGMQMIMIGAFAPGTVGGRRAHPPIPRDFSTKINTKERRAAIRSALSATMDKETVAERGHKVPASYPFILSSDFEKVGKTKDMQTAFKSIGLQDDLKRGERKHVRAGKGKTRGRRYKRAVGPLLVVSEKCEAFKAAKNVAGVDVVEISKINAELLAPGAHPGRLRRS